MSTRAVARRSPVNEPNQIKARTQRLNPVQRKTLELLRRNVPGSGNRQRQLTAYAKTLEDGKSKPALPGAIPRKGSAKVLTVEAGMPVTADDAKSILAFLNARVADRATGYLEFPGGVSHKAPVRAGAKGVAPRVLGAVIVDTAPVADAGDRSAARKPSFGLDLSIAKEKLHVTFRYRPVPGSLRLPNEKRAQGDLSARWRAAATGPVRAPRGDPADAVKTGVEALLNDADTTDLLGYRAPPLDDVAWQDFSEYLHVLPLSLMQAMTRDEPSLQVVQTLISLEKAGVDSAELGDILGALQVALGTRIAAEVAAFVMLDPDWTWDVADLLYPNQVEPQIAALTAMVAGKSCSRVMDELQRTPEALATLAEIHWALPAEHRQTYLNWVAASFRPADQGAAKFYFFLATPWADVAWLTTRWPVVASLAETLWGWALSDEKPAADPPPEVIRPYDFIYYTPCTWNLGLRLVYRQEWRALGNQRGEIVKTVPLGPRQTEKVSTRISRRTKVVRTAENLKSIETTTEMATSAKDSSETINEALNTSKGHVEADASASFGFLSASVSAGYEQSEEDREKQTTTNLTERSQKMASKIRQETKVTVSTESESSFETTTASEITNPNEEIALTYAYSKLQRQYRLFTQLAEVHNVVMIAEPLPAPEGIDDDWVRRHDSVLAKALLDDSYRDVLASFGQDLPQESLGKDVLDAIKTTVDDVAGDTGYLQKIGQKAVSIALDRVDPSQEAQRGYRDTQREELERKRARNLLVQKQRRFKQHVRDNLLHYYRAIWSAEDPQQRSLRYRKLGVRVPLRWEWVPGSAAAPDTLTLAELQDALAEIAEGGNGQAELNGFFRPVAASEKVALADLISNAGPIGYEGNYAIYYLNPRFERSDLLLLLQILKRPYLAEDAAGRQTVMSPALRTLMRERAGEGPAGHAEQLDMVRIVPELRLRHAIAKSQGADRESEFFAVYRLTKGTIEHLRATGGVGADILEALRLLQRRPEAATGRGEAAFIAFLGEKLHPNDVARHRESLLRYADQGPFTAHYPEYLLRTNQGASFLLDTGNVVIDIVPGSGSALESFKRMHRGVDVLKALDERTRIELDNKRRAGLIRDAKYGDPDIERVTIVAGTKEAAELVAAPVTTDEDEDEDEETPIT